MGWTYALQCELPTYPGKRKLKWEDVAYSNDAEALTRHMAPNSRVINIETKEVLLEHKIQR